MNEKGLSWFGIVRLGLVQTALGAIVVLTTSTINRVMIVELQFAAIIPGALVAWHYALQVLRPRWGHGSDTGGRRTPWIMGGMATLALGGFLAAASVHVAASQTIAGMVLAAFAFTLIGIGVGAAGTSLLVLLAEATAPSRRAAAATIVWIMMIAGFILTAGLSGHFLDPFSLTRLVAVAAAVALAAFLLSVVAVWGVERTAVLRLAKSKAETPFVQALREVWQDDDARRFAIFIFVSMLAYSAQDLILEPFAGLVFGMTPGGTTKLSGLQNGGVLSGMLLVSLAATLTAHARPVALRGWTVAGCLGSALALASLVAAASQGPGWPLKSSVFLLGLMNGIFAVAAIGSMFGMSAGAKTKEGVRMGLFGAAQAIAFGAGGFCGTLLADAMRLATASAATSYGVVFAVEALLFVAAALLAMRMGRAETNSNPLGLAARHEVGG
jgi:MFS transporter, BCD family, chlorophyll transporter